MDEVKIKGFGATLTFDGEQISIKHSFAGTVSTYVSQILGVDLKEPRGPIGGKLRIATASSSHKGIMPKQPWEFGFGFKQAEQMQALYAQLMQQVRPTGSPTA